MKIKVRYKISVSLIPKEVRKSKWKVGKLESNELTKEYQRNIADSLSKNSNDESTSVEEDWKNIKCAILSAADQIIGKKQFRRNQDWFDQECMDAIRIKNAARLKMLERYIRRTREDYNEKGRSAKRICRDKKKAAFGRRLENINNHHVVHKTRELYGKIKQERTGFYPRMYNIKSELGELLSESEDIKARWRTYFEDVFNGEKNELRQHAP